MINETNDNLTFILQLLHRNFKTSDRINLSLYTHPVKMCLRETLLN
jgi:hypothetical protein